MTYFTSQMVSNNNNYQQSNMYNNYGFNNYNQPQFNQRRIKGLTIVNAMNTYIPK
jgi:hypothetical protein